MELQVINTNGSNSGNVIVNEALFAREYNEALIHQVVNAFLANARQGTRAQKTRSEVNKSTHKPWRQKGTGRARVGSANSPLWRGGGRIFPNRPEENFTQKVNRKMYRAAIASILSKLIADKRLVIIESLEISTPKTKAFTAMIKDIQVESKAILFVVDELEENLYLASRNLPNVLILEAHQIDPYCLLRCEKIVITKKSLEILQEQFA